MKKTLFSLLGITYILAGGHLNAKVVKISNAQEYQQHYSSDKPMVTLYSADWCGPCQATKPHFHGAAEAASDITFAIVDTGIQGLRGIAKGIKSLPTMIFSHKGKPVKREIGSRSRTELNRHINEFRAQIRSQAPQKPAPQASQPEKKDTQKRIIKAPKPRPKKAHPPTKVQAIPAA